MPAHKVLDDGFVDFVFLQKYFEDLVHKELFRLLFVKIIRKRVKIAFLIIAALAEHAVEVRMSVEKFPQVWMPITIPGTTSSRPRAA